MFRSFNYKYFGYNGEKLHRYQVIIVDDDFIETATVFAVAPGSIATEAAALIDIYSRRNLNVASNLALLMQYTEHVCPWIDIKWQIECYQKEIPEYQKYHDQIMDYLIFL